MDSAPPLSEAEAALLSLAETPLEANNHSEEAVAVQSVEAAEGSDVQPADAVQQEQVQPPLPQLDWMQKRPLDVVEDVQRATEGQPSPL